MRGLWRILMESISNWGRNWGNSGILWRSREAEKLQANRRKPALENQNSGENQHDRERQKHHTDRHAGGRQEYCWRPAGQTTGIFLCGRGYPDSAEGEAIAEAEVEFNDGFKGRNNPIFREEVFSNVLSKLSPLFVSSSEIPTFNLLKIHGSINWKDSNGIDIKYDANCEILKKVLEKLEAIQDVILPISHEDKTLSELWPKEEVNKLDRAEKAVEIKDFIKEYDKLVMINPKKTKFMKSVIDHHFYELMRIYSNSLESQNSLLFVSGFSFADEHMANLTLRCANNNPTLTIIVFAYDNAAAAYIKECLHRGGNSRHDNIVVVTPTEFLSQQDEGYKEWTQQQKDHKLECFDMATINKFVYQQLKRMI